MEAENEPYRYNYQALDKLLYESCDPKELGNQLDEIMSDLSRLVGMAGMKTIFGQSLTYHHYMLRQLRDIFWWQLPKSNNNPNPSSDEQNT